MKKQKHRWQAAHAHRPAQVRGRERVEMRSSVVSPATSSVSSWCVVGPLPLFPHSGTEMGGPFYSLCITTSLDLHWLLVEGMTNGWPRRLQQGVGTSGIAYLGPWDWVVCNVPLGSDILGLQNVTFDLIYFTVSIRKASDLRGASEW